MDEMRTLKRLLVGLVLWAGLIVVMSVTTSDGARPAPASPAAVTSTSAPTAEGPPAGVTSAPTERVASSRVDDHDNLQRDAEMTQRMSAPNASGPMFSGQIRDPQLAHSQNPAFVRALEEHQADIDRMLARPTQ